jgi:hypothetical protein
VFDINDFDETCRSWNGRSVRGEHADRRARQRLRARRDQEPRIVLGTRAEYRAQW